MHGPGLTILADSNDLFLDGDPVDHSVLFTYLTGRPNTRYLTPRGAFDLEDFYVRIDAPTSAGAGRSASEGGPSYPQPLKVGSCPWQSERRSQ